MTDERRIKPRRHLIFYLRVFNDETGELIGYLGDIHTDGIMVMSETPIKADQDFTLCVKLHTELSDQESLKFKARSRWCKNDVNPTLYDTGFQ